MSKELTPSNAQESDGRQVSGGTSKPELLTYPASVQDLRRSQERWSQFVKPPLEQPNSVGMQMVMVPPGQFTMGVQSNGNLLQVLLWLLAVMGYYTAIITRWTSRITHTEPFWLARTPVTVHQFRQFVNATGYRTVAQNGGSRVSWEEPGYPQSDDHPVVNICWNDAAEFCEWLSIKESRTYTLPTEAQWEYACRAGTTTRFNYGNASSELADHAWYSKNSSSEHERHPHDVGQKLSNGLGLLDMHGNVREWCWDWFSNNLPAGEDPVYADVPNPESPFVPRSAPLRVTRGGGWSDSAFDCTSAARHGLDPGIGAINVGFRVALRPGDGDPKRMRK